MSSGRLKNRKGFTLIEILIVLAISVILMGLVLAPVVQSFNMTRRARAMADAQDAARHAMEMFSREIGEAMFVYENSRRAMTVFDKSGLPGTVLDEGPLQLPVRNPSGSIQWFVLPNAKLDLILPKVTMHCQNPRHPDTHPRDYPRGNEAWPECPVCKSDNVDAKPTLPLQREATVVRYFLGLRYNDPSKTNPATLAEGEGLFGWRTPYGERTEYGEENQVVLYRAEFDPTDDTLFPAGMSVAERLSDPIFFYRPNYCKKWADLAQVVGMGQYQDLITAEFDSSGNATSVEPSVKFRFAAVDNDPFTGTFAQDKSFEYPDAVPTVFAASYGYWTALDGISVYRNTQDDNGNDVTVEYTTRYVPVSGVQHLMIMRRDDTGNERQEFDITDYLNKLVAGNLTTIARPSSSEAPEMAFIFDYGVTNGQVWLNFNRGIVNFALAPPRPQGQSSVVRLDPLAINLAYMHAFDRDRGSARRLALLDTFNPDTSGWVANTRMVPGSDRVVGPDMTPPVSRVVSNNTVHFRSRSNTPVVYERVPLNLGDPGPNQYKVDYDTGVLYFSSAYDQHLPDQFQNGTDARIDVDYKIYFNRLEDAVKGSYTTKDLVNIHLEMRMFDPESGKPHSVDLTNSVKVRNALR